MMTIEFESDHVMYLSALNMRSDWLSLLITTFWQMIHCSLQTKTRPCSKPCRETARTMPLHSKIRCVSKFRAASRSSPCDSTTFLFYFMIQNAKVAGGLLFIVHRRWSDYRTNGLYRTLDPSPKT